MSSRKEKSPIRELTANNLKDELWITLIKLRNREIPPQAALAIAANAREIMRVVRAELTIASATGTPPTKQMIGTNS